MSAQLVDLKAQRDRAIAKADEILSAAERGKRALTTTETSTVDQCTAEANHLNAEIARIETVKSYRLQQRTSDLQVGNGKEKMTPKKFSAEYADGFQRYLISGNPKISASLMEEGVNVAGGFAVPVVVDGQIVPLAPQDLAVRRLSTVIPTRSDIKVPTKTAKGTVAAKAEASSFATTQQTLGQFVLSAFMAGAEEQTSVEVAEDAPAFTAFCLDDLSIAIQEYEENLFVNGTGVGQPQGLIGNVGTGVTEEPDAGGNLVSINGTLDLIGQLPETYAANATWLMSRATAIIIRKAQVQSNVFIPAWTRENGQDFLHGYPVAYSAFMPAAARGNAPVLFGDFKRAYLIGDRGGSAISVKVLDQLALVQGLVTLFGYRRTDGRVRRSEAIQQYTIAAS